MTDASADTNAAASSPARMPPGRAPGSALRAFVIVAVAIVVACVVVTAIATRPSHDQLDALMQHVRTNRMQAVELDNDRVYFGELRAAGDGWLELRSAYYIREQPASDRGEGAKPIQQVAPVQSELTQPDGSLLINAEHVIRIQNLRANSRVTQAIDDVKAG